MLELDWTMLSTYWRCPKEYHLFAMKNLQGSPSLALEMGSDYHDHTEWLYGEADEFNKFIQRIQTQDPVGLLLDEYFDSYYTPDLERFSEIKAEGKLSVKVSNNRTYSACCDLSVYDASQKLWYIVEHKTSGRNMNTLQAEHYATSEGQVSGQLMIGMEKWGPDFGGVLLRHANIPKTNIFELHIIPNQDRVDSFKENVIDTMRDMEHTMSMSLNQKRVSGCIRFFSKCPYYDVCHNMSSTDSYRQDQQWKAGEKWIDI